MERSRFNRINNSYSFRKDALKWNWLCFPSRAWRWGTQFSCHCLVPWPRFLLGHQLSPHHCFCIIHENASSAKKTNDVCDFMRTVLTLQTFWKPLSSFQVSGGDTSEPLESLGCWLCRRVGGRNPASWNSSSELSQGDTPPSERKPVSAHWSRNRIYWSDIGALTESLEGRVL